MLAKDIATGKCYKAMVSGKLVTVRVDSIREVTTTRYTNGKAKPSEKIVYDVTNLNTSRKLTFNSAAKFRREVSNPLTTVVPRPITPSVVSVDSVNTPEFALDTPNKPSGGQHGPCPMPDSEPVSILPQRKLGQTDPIPIDRIKEKLEPHVVVIARAGTGKTFTLIEGLKKKFGLTVTAEPMPQQKAVWDALCLGDMPKYCTFAAFNNTIADELKRRVPPGAQAKTLHSIGYAAVRRSCNLWRKIDQGDAGDRVFNIIEELTGTEIRQLRKENNILVTAIDSLVGKCKVNLIDWSERRGTTGFRLYDTTDEKWIDEVNRLASHYDIELGKDEKTKNRVIELVPQVLERCLDVRKDGYIDFNDMIWLPIVLNLPVFQNDLLLVDEFQDMNICQRELAIRAGKRLVLCGDPAQAIYGFAGADSDSIDKMIKTLEKTDRGVVVLPLTVTRRCGKVIVKEAQSIVRDFEAHDTNGPGKIREASYTIENKVEVPYEKTYMPLVKDGDMILCRANAPLVTQCFKFLKLGRKATIQGRNVAASLISLLEKIGKECGSGIPDFLMKLQDWLDGEVKKEQSKKNPSESRIQGLEDRYDCLKCFAEVSISVDEIKTRINSVFTDNPNLPGIKLSSIHRAKGLEAHNVFYIQGFGRPLEKMKPWEQQQERNLQYVAITRAIETLTYVS